MSASPNPSSNGDYTVSWTPVTGAQSYELYESTNGGATWGFPMMVPAFSSSKSFTDKAPGSYTYKLYSCWQWFPPGSPHMVFECGYVNGMTTVTVRPPVPTGLTAPATDYNGSYTVSWNSSSGATSYQLQERFNSGSWTQIHSGTATSKARSGRAAGSWSYRVRACIGTNCSGWSGIKTVTVKPPPSVPAGLTAPGTDYNGAYTVSWNTATGATSYRLQEKVGSGSWAQIHSGSATSKAVSGKSPATYSYRVRSCGPESVCSSWSSAISVVVEPPPSVPSGLTAPSTDHNGAYTVSWNAATGATSYRLEERLGSGSWTQVHSGSATSKAISGNSPGTYSYRVRSCAPESVCSSWSSTVSVTVVPAPAAPTGLTGPGTDYNGAYTISWNAASGATSYRLEEQVGTGSWSQVHSGAATSKAISGKSQGSYSYRVRACNVESVCGSWSATHTVTVPAPPAVPTGLTGPTVSESGSYTISWNASSGSSSYRLEEREGSGSWSQIHSGSATSKAVSGKAVGTWSYRVKGCNAESVCSAWSATHTVEVPPSIEPPATAPSPAPMNDPGQASAAETDTIGSTAGNFRVDESGAATYSIPIASAAGTAGVEPQVSLNYSSGAGNNIAGMGWSIGGLSSISRCRQTFDQDRNVSRLSFTSSDRFCLDGTRLLLTSTHNYGAAGSTYRAEVDDGSMVTVVGSTSGEPDYFEVKRKDGSVSYYGKAPGNADTSAKLGDGAGRTLTWAIRQFKDSVGNPIWFEYDTSNGGQRISAIKWAYGASTDPESGYGARFQFVYESRLDPKSGYVDGALFQNDQRLKTIVSYNNVNQEIRRYNLRYNEGIAVTSDNLSRLTSVEECNGATCLPKTTFGWLLPVASPGWTTIDTFSIGSNVVQFAPADINGDGRMDLVWVQGTTSFQLRYALYNGSGYTITPFSSGSTSLSLGQFIGEKMKVFDYNLDGRQDIALHEKGPDRWNVVLSQPHGGSSWRLSSSMIATNATGAATFIDVDSNGTTDALNGDMLGDLHLQRLRLDPSQSDSSSRRYAYGPEVPVSSTVEGCFGAIQSGAPDFDGDGQVDVGAVVAPEPCQYPWFIGPGTAVTFSGFTGVSPTTTHYHEFPALGFQTTDVNSDGLSDALYPVILGPTGDFEMRLDVNRGNGTFDTVDVLTDSIAESDTHSQFADWNMDGYPDLLWKDNTGAGSLRARYWNPDTGNLGPALTVNSTVSTSELESISIFDVNGDAVPDLVRVNADGTPGSIVVSTRNQGSTTAFAGVNRINSITNGLGATTHIEYEPLSYSAHYERLEYTTSPGSSQVCEPAPGGSFCWDEPIQVPNVGAFYEKINGDWDYPSTWQYLKKASPIIEMSGPLYVVTEVESDAPSAGSSPGAVNNGAESSISYYYGEAKIQAAGRGFLGFQRLTTIDDQSGVKTTTRYRQDWPFIGRPISTIVTSSAGHLLSTSKTEWEIIEWDSTARQTAEEFGTAALGPLHVVQKKHEVTTYDLVSNGAAVGGKVSTATTESEFDLEGNTKEITVTTRNAADQIVKSVHTSNEYDGSTFALWEGRLTRTTVTTGSTVRTSSFSYHQSGAHRGLLWKETIEPDNAEYTLITEHSYDARGNRVKSKQTGGSEARCDALTSTFDSRHRYVDVTRDCLGRKTSEVTSRNKFGAPASIETFVDAGASFSTHIFYSALGREYYRYKGDGSSQTSYLTSSTINCPAGTAFKSLKASSGGGESQECFDSLGRITRSLTLGFDGQWDAEDTEYDEFGRVKRKSEPYDLGTGAQYWTTFQYDLLGRVTRADLPDGSWGTTAYSGLTTVKTAHASAGSRSKTEVRNAAGELVQVIDNLGGSTTYGYDDQGNLSSITDNDSNTSVMDYDLLGRKISTNDPDKGFWEYDYNHFGELTFQKNANGQTSTMTYDGLGRIKTRIDRLSESGPVEGSTVWEYDTAAYGLGQLASVQDTVSGFMRANVYDSLGRVSEVITNFGGGVYYEATTYDQFGRVYQVFDAAGDGTYTSDGIVNGYNAYGHLESVADAVLYGTDPRVIYRRILAMNAHGQVTAEERGIDIQQGTGPATTTTYEYWPASGRMKSISGVNPVGFDVQDLEYTWDQLGNLTQREEYSGSKSLTETFQYDGLNRLTQASVVGQGTVTVTYDTKHLGNIKTKSDVGTYAYNSSRPHAVTSAGGATYTYDANGNNLTGDGRVLRYTTFDKPYEITKGGHETTFAYDPGRARYLRVDQGSEGTTTTRYIGSVEIIDRPDGTQERKRYIAGVAIETRTVTGGVESGRTTLYVHNDHLGSLDVITDASGAVVQELSFDPWGQRRNATTWAALSTQDLIGFDHSLTTRGFTGHEMLDEVGLIHMNGRVYDPKLARFLQADPFVQDLTNSQALNRYSYVWNNPLNATDPSGYMVFTIVAMIAVASKAITAVHAIVAAFAAASFADTLLMGGSFKDALLSGIAAGVSAGAFAKIGAMLAADKFSGTFAANLNGLGFSIKVASHGVIGGITSVIQGGKFGHGFASGFFTAAATSFNNSQFIGGEGFSPGRVIVGAVVGGTASEISGGKFANGAITGAFSQALNNELSEERAVRAREFYEDLVRNAGELFEPGLFPAIDATLEAGHEAAEYWAARETQTGNSLYKLPGVLASLWTRGTAGRTFLTLVPIGGGTGAHAARPFWRYIGPNSNPASPWLTRRLFGFTAPYGDDYIRARNALQLPHMPSAVVPVRVPWHQPVIGPGVVYGNSRWGYGGGWEYARGWRWP